MILVDLDRVAASRPGRPLFHDLSVTLSSGDRLGVVGLNGCGKSTLLGVIAGDVEPEAGTVRRGRGVTIAALAQRPALPAGRVVDVVGEGLAHELAGPDPGEHDGARWEAASVVDRIGLRGLADTDIGSLSGGQTKRVALARTLVAPSDLLVLDEPTNHLDIDGIAWLEDRLADFRGGLVLVTHDRHVLDRVTTRILELDRGRAYVHEGGYAAYLEARARRDELDADAESTRRNLARKELAWLRRGAPARTRKPKARVEAATTIVEGRAEGPARVGLPDLHLGTPRLGDKVVELHDVGHRWPGDPAPLFEGVDLLLDRRERLGVVGPNGSGKSTLLELMAGRREPTEGRVVTGPTVHLGYYDQLGVTLDPTQRVRDAVAGGCARARLARRRAARAVLVLRRHPVGADRAAVGRRAPSPAAAAHPGRPPERAAARRADQRSRRRHAAGARGVPRRLAGRAGRRQPRSRVPRADRGRRRGARRIGSRGVPPGRVRGLGGRASCRAPAVSLTRRPRSGSTGGPGRPPAREPERDGDRTTPSPSTRRRQLALVGRELAALEKRQAELEAELAGAGSDHETLARVGAELAHVAAAVAEVEERWLELATGEE